MSKKQRVLHKYPNNSHPWWRGVKDKDIRYMSLTELIVTYIVFTCVFEAEWMYGQLGILMLYLMNFWVFYMAVTGLTRAEKLWSFMRQTSVAVASILPLIAVFCAKWVW